MAAKPIEVLVAHAADSPGYTHLLVHPAVGDTQAPARVVCRKKGSEGEEHVLHVLHLSGQREFDVPNGCEVVFPDGGAWTQPK